MSDEENLISFVNCSELLTTEEIIHEITGQETSCCNTTNNLNYYPWKIDNKYYITNVRFIVTKTGEEEILKNNTFSAFVVLFDCNEKSFKLVDQWLPCIKLHGASVLLLVGSKTIDKNIDEKTDPLPRLQVVEWCIKHSFEFIDLNEEIDPEDDFPDTVGVARIIQALETTEWSNLQMKDNGTQKTSSAINNPSAHNVEPNIGLDSNSSIPNDGTTTTTTTNPFLGDLNNFSELINGMNDSDDDTSFEQLFSQMQLLKGQASNLPNSERKAYAEQVAVAFWNAIGGDEDEIDDLNS